VEPYKDKNWLHTHYVKKRMKTEDIAQLLADQYDIQTTHQTIYNWCKKYNLLRHRGKGRTLNKGAGGVKRTRVKSPRQKRMEEMKRRSKKNPKKRR